MTTKLDREAGLVELRERVRGATEPDRIVDLHIAEAFDIPEPWQKASIWPPFSIGSKIERSIPEFTSSIDASWRLVDRVLPEANCRGMEITPLGCDAHVSRNNVTSGHWLYESAGRCATAPLAILDALLSALIAKASSGEGE